MSGIARRHLLGAALASGGLLIAGSAAAEVQLRALSSMATSWVYSEAYIEHFIERVNQTGSGVVRISYMGGPEAIPRARSAEALERGVVDLLYGPAGYYAGAVPEAYALHGATVGPAVIRENGGFELLDKIWGERLNAKIIGWGISETAYNLYLTERPKLTDDGLLTLEGMRMRSMPTYRPLLDAFGATSISVDPAEFHTAIERGMVQGSGWPEVGLAGTGVDKLLKYKLEPTFFRSNHLVIMNRDRWNALSPEAKRVLEQAALYYEEASVEHIGKVERADAEQLAAQGMEFIELTGAARDDYRRRANDRLWQVVAERSDHAEELRRLLDPE